MRRARVPAVDAWAADAAERACFEPPRALLAHHVAAIDVQGLGGDVGRFVAGEKHRRAGHLTGAAHVSERHGFAYRSFLLPWLETFIAGEERINLLPHRCVDHARSYRVHSDAVRRHREGCGLRVAYDRRLGGAIVRDKGLAAPARLRGEVDDRPRGR